MCRFLGVGVVLNLYQSRPVRPVRPVRPSHPVLSVLSRSVRSVRSVRLGGRANLYEKTRLQKFYIPYFASNSKVKSQFLTIHLYCVPFVWIPSIQKIFLNKFEVWVSFLVLLSSHGPETPTKLKIRCFRCVRNFRNFTEFRQ